MPSSSADNNPAFANCDTRILLIPATRQKYACDTRAVFNSSLVTKLSIFTFYQPLAQKIFKRFYVSTISTAFSPPTSADTVNVKFSISNFKKLPLQRRRKSASLSKTGGFGSTSRRRLKQKKCLNEFPLIPNPQVRVAFGVVWCSFGCSFGCSFYTQQMASLCY